MLAKMYHAVIPRRSAARLCWTAIPSTPGSILPPPFVEDGPPPAPTEGGLPRSTVGPAPEAWVMQGHLEGVCLGALQGEPGLKSRAQCVRSPRAPPWRFIAGVNSLQGCFAEGNRIFRGFNFFHSPCVALGMGLGGCLGAKRVLKHSPGPTQWPLGLCGLGDGPLESPKIVVVEVLGTSMCIGTEVYLGRQWTSSFTRFLAYFYHQDNPPPQLEAFRQEYYIVEYGGCGFGIFSGCLACNCRKGPSSFCITCSNWCNDL